LDTKCIRVFNLESLKDRIETGKIGLRPDKIRLSLIIWGPNPVCEANHNKCH
jgi:hypothetical protein